MVAKKMPILCRDCIARLIKHTNIMKQPNHFNGSGFMTIGQKLAELCNLPWGHLPSRSFKF